MTPFENYIANQTEPNKGCLLALKDIILGLDSNLTTAWKYNMPFFCYKKKMFCYFWMDKITNEPYIGVVEGGRIDHPLLEQGNRKRMKILRIDPNEDLPVEAIETILNEALTFYQAKPE